MSPSIKYRVIPSSLEAHIFTIVLTISEPDPTGQLLRLPAWIPGSYMIRDFSKDIVSIDASCGGKNVVLLKLDKHTWKAEEVPLLQALVITYDVYAWDLSVRTAHLDTSHGFFNGTSMFLRVVGQEKSPQQVQIEVPRGENQRHWKVATTLPAEDVDTNGFGVYKAQSYALLIDYPVEMGEYQELDFCVQNIPHRMVFSGRCYLNKQRVTRDIQRICSYHADLFGELPVKQYLFMTLVTGDGYGGLEHLDSTALMCKRDDLPASGLGEADKGYRRFLGLCSHEYFHLWNVKRIQPLLLQQADLTTEVHTKLLWAFEGITSYYDDLGLVRSGCITPDSYLELMTQNITLVMRGSGRTKQSIAESSFDAWTKFYKQDENAPNAIVSYYAKGTLAALGLDMLLRDQTGGVKSLDDLMRKLWQEHGQPGKGVAEDGIETLASQLAGRDLSNFFEQVVYGKNELDLANWLATLGIGLCMRPSKGKDDWGSTGEPVDSVTPTPDFGARFGQKDGFVELLQVYDDGAAQRCGLSAGDRIIAVDQIQVNETNLLRHLNRFAGAEYVTVHAFRRDELMVFELPIQEAAADTCQLWFLPHNECTAAQLERRSSWLNTQ